MEYIITVLGNFEEQKKIDEITKSLQKLILNEDLTFNYNDYSLIACLNSDISLETLSSKVRDLLYLKAELVLISPSEVTSIVSNDEFIKHLMNCHPSNDTNNVSIEFTNLVDIGLERLKDEIMKFEEDENDDDEDEIESIIERSILKLPTLDDLLDKITDKGFKSLTKKEKQLLQILSK